MCYRKSIFLWFLALTTIAFPACRENEAAAYRSPQGYNLEKPEIMYLDDALVEISGVCYYPKDSSVFAISDENGYLYKIHLTGRQMTERWYFDKTLDYEDVYYRNNVFYVLVSNGDIHALKFSPHGDTLVTQTTVFDPAGKGKDEFESLYFDSGQNYFVLLCKKCQGDSKHKVSAWAYYPEDGRFVPSVFTLHSDEISAKASLPRQRFEPSAATINPLTGDLWILSSVEKMLVITDSTGKCKAAYSLNPGVFTQPEGITFTPSGDLIISNEAGSKYNRASLLIFKRKKIS